MDMRFGNALLSTTSGDDKIWRCVVGIAGKAGQW